MSSQRPFFANFFTAFRARTTTGAFQAKSSTTTGAVSPLYAATSQFCTSTSTAAGSAAPRNVSPKGTADIAPQHSVPQPIKGANASHFNPTAIVSASPGTTFYRRPPSPSPSHHLTRSPGHITPTQMTRGRQRRDSGSSNTSGGFIDASGPEKWYIGGRTATGEERFYQLGMVTGSNGRRVRSLDRLSM